MTQRALFPNVSDRLTPPTTPLVSEIRFHGASPGTSHKNNTNEKRRENMIITDLKKLRLGLVLRSSASANNWPQNPIKAVDKLGMHSAKYGFRGTSMILATGPS
jgi:hypothetical protein